MSNANFVDTVGFRYAQTFADIDFISRKYRPTLRNVNLFHLIAHGSH